MTLYVSAIVYQNIAGHCDSRVFYPEFHQLKVGQQVKIAEASIHDDRPTGCYIYRYIVAIEPCYDINNYVEACYMRLSPFSVDEEVLGLSGVRNSDNLESI